MLTKIKLSNYIFIKFGCCFIWWIMKRNQSRSFSMLVSWFSSENSVISKVLLRFQGRFLVFGSPWSNLGYTCMLYTCTFIVQTSLIDTLNCLTGSFVIYFKTQLSKLFSKNGFCGWESFFFKFESSRFNIILMFVLFVFVLLPVLISVFKFTLKLMELRLRFAEPTR